MFDEEDGSEKSVLMKKYFESYQVSKEKKSLSLTEKEKKKIKKFMDKEKPFEDVLDMFDEEDGSAKAVLIKNYFESHQIPSKPVPVRCRRLKAKITGNSLPLYWYGKHEKHGCVKYFTFLVVGEMGTGKTTFLDAFVNCLTGMKFTDEWRWKLVDESWQKESESKSQTTDITCYHIIDERLGRKCHVKIIDTPGFGDISGIKNDQRIVAKLETLFKTEIEELDYILVVTKASETRMTCSKKYMYDQVQALFGSEAATKFVLMLTFADGGTPMALKTLEGQLHWQQYFTFNNSALYMPSKNGTAGTKMYWKMCMESINNFLQFVLEENDKPDVKPLSLGSTREVMAQREFMHTRINSAQDRIKVVWMQLDDFKNLVKRIMKDKDQINKNGSYTYEETVPVTSNRRLAKAIQFCRECNQTCCDICEWPEGQPESSCTYFDTEDSCPKCGCPKSDHRRLQDEVTTSYKKVTRVYKQQYLEGKKNMSAAQTLLKEKHEKMDKVGKNLLQDMQSVKSCLKKLDEIALKPRVFTENDYFIQMIKFEEETKEDGWTIRVAGLKEMAVRAETLKKIENLDDWFPVLQKEANDALKQGGADLESFRWNIM